MIKQLGGWDPGWCSFTLCKASHEKLFQWDGICVEISKKIGGKENNVDIARSLFWESNNFFFNNRASKCMKENKLN